MRRKECDNKGQATRETPTCTARRLLLRALLAAMAPACFAVPAWAGTVRVWPTAVTVEPQVRLGDISVLSGFEASAEQMLREIVVADSPPPGGSRLIHMDMVRAALASGSANMATVTLRGAMRCAVSRPAPLVQSAGKAPSAAGSERANPGHRVRPSRHVEAATALTDARESIEAAQATTLREAVVTYFDDEFARYRGTSDVMFDRSDDHVLDLSGPDYGFRIRRRGASPLGLVSLEVEVLSEGRTLQMVPLVVRVAITRHVVVARRSINQGATIRSADVDLMPLSFTRLDGLGVDDVAQVIGQRAKRYAPAGTMIEPGLLEVIPLVVRGQLVNLSSVAGSVRVTTTAKATESGYFGDLIKVRGLDSKRVEFDAVVVGPGAVQMGPIEHLPNRTRLVTGGGR